MTTLAREYELVYILEPRVNAEEADTVAAKIADIISQKGGKLTKADNWGKKKFAYIIKKQKRGYYVFNKFAGGGDMVSEIERNLRNYDSVLRFQTVRLDGTVDLSTLVVDPKAAKLSRLEIVEEVADTTLEERLGFNRLAARDRAREDAAVETTARETAPADAVAVAEPTETSN